MGDAVASLARAGPQGRQLDDDRFGPVDECRGATRRLTLGGSRHGAAGAALVEAHGHGRWREDGGAMAVRDLERDVVRAELPIEGILELADELVLALVEACRKIIADLFADEEHGRLASLTLAANDWRPTRWPPSRRPPPRRSGSGAAAPGSGRARARARSPHTLRGSCANTDGVYPRDDGGSPIAKTLPGKYMHVILGPVSIDDEQKSQLKSCKHLAHIIRNEVRKIDDIKLTKLEKYLKTKLLVEKVINKHLK